MAESVEPLYKNDFQQAAVGGAPEEFLVLDGAFGVKEDSGNRFLELPGDPLETFGVLFGPTQKSGGGVGARIFGTAKGRRFPTFGVGLNGVGGYRLQVSPAKKTIELYRGDELKADAPYEWDSGQWTRFYLQVRKTGDKAWHVGGKVWAEGGEKPAGWSIAMEVTEEPYAGRAALWGSPFSGTPIRYDDLEVEAVADP